MYQTGCSAYRQSAANTVEDKRVILLKLYEGALVFNKIAKRAIRNNAPRIRGENLGKTMAVISELQCALDHEKGGEISTRLDTLYRYIMDRLMYAGKHKDIEALDQVESVLLTLKEGFEEALKGQKSTAPQAPVLPAAMPLSDPPQQAGVQFAV